jgi:hypothetical protein
VTSEQIGGGKVVIKPCIKPPYRNGNKWNVRKCKMLFNIRYQPVISMVYQRKKRII